MQALRGKAGLILFALGISIVCVDALRGGGDIWIVIFPFVFRGTLIGALGVLLMFIGFLLWALSRAGWRWEVAEAGSCRCEGLVLIGPIPVFLRGRSAVLVPLLLMLFFMLGFLILLFLILL